MIETTAEFFTAWPYDEALQWMDTAFLSVKSDASKLLLGCGTHREHVITLGKNPLSNGLSDQQKANVGDLIVRHIDRGGGATAHVPGQLVLYPVLNIDRFELTVPLLVTLMEDAMITFLDGLGMKACRSTVGPGVFIDGKKIGFIGLRIKDRISTHGLAINVLNDTDIFRNIDPCGIKELKVTSAKEHTVLRESLPIYMAMLVSSFLKAMAKAKDR